MAQIRDGATYLRVSHAGQSTGSLYLADLDDEENKLQNKGDVLLSYQQGTIRGFLDDGLVTANILDQGSSDSKVIFVSTSGDDSNPGTVDAPLASPQEAVNKAHEAPIQQHVEIIMEKAGPSNPYPNRVIVNRPNMTVRCTNPNDNDVNLDPDDSSHIPLVVTNLTVEAWEQFVADGGIEFSRNDTTFTWDSSADLRDREVAQAWRDWGSDFAHPNIHIKGITLSTDGINMNGEEISLAAVKFPREGDSNTSIAIGLNFEQCNAKADTLMYFKNFGVDLRNSTMTDVVLDNCWDVKVNSESFFFEKVYSRIDTSGNAEEAPPSFLNYTFYNFGTAHFDENVWAYHTDDQEFIRGSFASGKGGGHFSGNLTLNGNADIGSSDGPRYLKVVGDLTIRDGTDVYAEELHAGTLTKTGSGTLDAHLIQSSGAVSIEGGTSNTLRGGVIQGNLTVTSGNSITLYDVKVIGDLEGAGDITMYGGGYTGANNNTGSFTYNALKTT